MPTILHVADYGGPYSGNFIASLIALNEELQKNFGLDLALVFSDVARGRQWLKQLDDRQIPYDFIVKEQPHALRLAALKNITKIRKPILIHTHFTSFDIETAFLAYSLKIPLVWHVHGILGNNFSLKRKMKDIIKFKVFARKWVNRIVAVSDGAAQNIIRRGAPSNKVITIYNGIDVYKIQK